MITSLNDYSNWRASNSKNPAPKDTKVSPKQNKSGNKGK